MENTLTIDKDVVRGLYAKTDKQGRELLRQLIGSDTFFDIRDTVLTYADAYALVGSNPGHKSMVAYMELQTICTALNQGWEPNWNDASQHKFYPVFVLRCGFCAYVRIEGAHTCTSISSRLVFKTEELAQYAGEHFIELYRQFLSLQ